MPQKRTSADGCLFRATVRISAVEFRLTAYRCTTLARLTSWRGAHVVAGRPMADPAQAGDSVGLHRLTRRRLVDRSAAIWLTSDLECAVPALRGPASGAAINAYVGTMPSLSRTNRTSSKAALMFPFGNRICPSPWMLLNSSQPSSRITIARPKPRRPWNRPAS